MDKGLAVLLSLGVLLIGAIVCKVMGIVSSELVGSIIGLSLVYHTGYTLYQIIEWTGRHRIRNKKRGNLRPPRSNRDNPWN
jgi:hypothetical protein